WDSTGQLWGAMEFEEIYQAVNLASLIEKETALPEERKTISGVFHNRLDKKMLLQCDPTIIYGLGLKFDGNLRRTHLQDWDNPYNTYRHRGFPPTPICSPGLASLEAALNPEEHDYLYFVSRNDGSHHFSRNLSQHNRAVRKFQK
ncbi:MAG: endolytic transglycosylase MltG, partial [Desulfonatronovibrionaceae bacterium]